MIIVKKKKLELRKVIIIKMDEFYWKFVLFIDI